MTHELPTLQAVNLGGSHRKSSRLQLGMLAGVREKKGG